MRNSHLNTLCLALFLITPFLLSAQALRRTQNPNWIAKDPFEQKVFIENNKGQFDGKIIDSGKILFSSRINGVDVYFTNTGLAFRHDSIEINREAKDENENEDEPPVITPRLFLVKWVGANTDATVIPEQEVKFYYTYPGPNGTTIVAHAFKKLLYQHIYPGIDIEYSFKPDEKGLEYSVIVHPGADLSLVKEEYADALTINKNQAGDVIIQSSFGQFTEKAPAKTYYPVDNTQLFATTNLNGSIIGFNAGNYDHTKTLIIDPLLFDPFFPSDAVYDIDYDWQGNIYAYGSFNPYQVAKFDANGIIQWSSSVYTSVGGIMYYGDIAVNKASGKTYVGAGSNYPQKNIVELDNSGMRVDSFRISPAKEIWRLEYDECLDKIVIGIGGYDTIVQMAILDTSLTSCTQVNTLAASTPQHDVCLMSLDEYDKNHAFFAVSKRYYTWGDTTFNNRFVKCPLPALAPANFIVFDGDTFSERAIGIVPQQYVATNAMNGMAVSPDWVYLYDGEVLKRFNKNTGALSAQRIFSPLTFTWGGLDVDECNNVYIGCQDTAYILDSNLNTQNSISYPGFVYDLRLANGNILACGTSFIASYPAISNGISLSISRTTASSCTNSDGTATVHVQSCITDTSVYSYQWSNGQTNRTATGLALGNYTVTVSLGCDMKYTDTVNIQALPTGGVTLNFTVRNERCFGDSNASIEASPSGGTAPYTYNWQPGGGTLDSINNLKTGTYTVTVSDSTGCAAAIISITQPQPISVGKSSLNEVSCYGGSDGSVSLYANGGNPAYTYFWQPAEPSSNTIGNLTAGTYTVIVIDANGCTATDTVPITQPPPLNVTTAPVVDCYQGQSVTLTASGTNGVPPYVYLWEYYSSGSSYAVSPTDTTTYQLQVIDANGCRITVYVTVDVLPACTVFVPDAFSPNGDGQNDVLYVRGSACIQWLDFTIYDRWGNKVFESQKLEDGWDGKYRGQPMNAGTYVYNVDAYTLDNKYISKHGTIALVR